MRGRRLLLSALVAAAAAALASAAWGAPPAGPTGIALDGHVELAWQPAMGATAYNVYRGTTPGAITTRITPVGGTVGLGFDDTGAVNGTTYYYAVRAIVAGVESASSAVVEARPVARSCASGNPVVLENCFPGAPLWNVTGSLAFASGGIEGFASETSIDNGGAVALKARTGAATTMTVEIYRSGWYGGSGARLVSRVRGLAVGSQPACLAEAQTGLYDCSGWASSGTVTTTPSWPSGVYLIRFVRDDNGADWQTVLAVRDDSRNADLLYTVPDTTYQAYNNYGGKSLYSFNSTGAVTVAGTARAVKVSFDRPYVMPGDTRRPDWYPRSDFPLVSWLERWGYDVNYQSDLDLDRDPARVRAHRAVVLGAHDEYYSAGMRTALEQGRDAGTSIFSSGANQVFWKIRFEPSPVTGAARRVEVGYKTSEGGAEDPVTPTRRFRDPVLAQPENALLGSMYVGDNSEASFPLVVPAAAGADRIWRYTGLDAQAPGTSTSIGTALVSWEWDGRFDNGAEPAGVKTLSASPVTGHILQPGGGYVDGPAVSTSTKYTAASGALVFQTGSNRWAWGLARNADGLGEPDRRIQQAATNVLADMGAAPLTPPADITLDSASAPRVTSTAPLDGQGGVALSTTVRAVFSRAMNPATITASTFTLRRPDGTAVAATVAYDAVATTATLTPAAPLANATTYTARLDTAVAATDGTPLQSAHTWVFTTIGVGTTKRINSGGGAFTAADGRVFDADAFYNGGSPFTSTAAIAGTTDDGLYQSERWGQFSYAIPVQNATYDVKLHLVELYYVSGSCVGKRRFGIDLGDTPGVDVQDMDVCAQAGGANTALVLTLTGVTVADGILDLASVYGAADDPELAAIEIVPSALPPGTPTVSATTPAAGATGVPVSAPVTATFSTAMDASTVDSASFLLERAGTAVAAAVTYDSGTRTATLTPSAPLAGGTTYTARVTTGAESTAGVPLASPVSWTFTTATAPTPGAIRINAGGGAFTAADGRVFAADASFTGGGTYSSGAAIAGTADDGLYQNERWGQFSYAIPVANGNYDLTLHFVELYYVSGGCTGRRVFSVDVADTAGVDVSNLDVCAAAGGPNTALTRTVPVSVADGVLNLASVYGAADDPELAAIEVVPTGGTPPPPAAPTVTARTPADGATGVAASVRPTATFSRSMSPATITASSFTLAPAAGGAAVAATVAYDEATLTATLTPSAALAASTAYTARLATTIQAADGTALAAPVTWTFTTAAAGGGGGGGSTVRLNVGGGAFTTADGRVFAADAGFSGGGTYATTRPIAGTTDDALYQNERWGQFSYAIPVANGTYEVRLHFVEIYYGSAVPGGAGKRVFSIDIGDTPGTDVANLDIYAEAGADAALVKTVTGVQVADGVLNLQSIYGSADDPELAAVEIVASGGGTPPPPGADEVGVWREPTSWPHVAVHLSMLPNGDILSFDGFDDAVNSEAIWKPSADTFTAVPYGRNLFCSAHLLLPDGKTFVAGGHVQAYEGLADTTLFDATTNAWTRAPDMAVPRWYPSATLLSDGRVLVFSGDNIVQNRPGATPPFSDASVDSLPEVYDPQANTWTALPGARLTSPLYPFLFVLTNGKVFDAGPDTTTRTLDPATWTWSTVGTSPIDGMSAVLYRPDKVMKSGSWADPDFNGSLLYSAHGRTAVIDVAAGSPAWRETSPMSYPRAYHTLTLLPDGTVLASGGGSVSDGVDLTKSVLPAEIWNPVTETWRTVAPLVNGRLYHSTALLLADGRVLMAGGGQLPGSTAVNQRNAEVYSPPYLFKGPRPVISAVPSQLAYGSPFTVTTPDADRIASVALVRTPSVTHALDMNQRYVPLPFVRGSGSLSVTAPAGGGTAPPGYYMLFLVDTNGVPSVASFVRLPVPAGPPPPGDTTPPAVSVTAPAANATVSATVSLGASASDDTGVAGVQFRVDGVAVGPEDATAPYTASWDTTAAGNGSHTVTAVARDAAGNTTTSAGVTVTVQNAAGPPAGLVAAYSFNAGAGSTVADASGNGNTGTLAGPAWTAAGRNGGGLSFDGVNDLVTVADSASLDLTAGMTLEAWVRPSGGGNTWRTVMLKEQPGDLVYGLYSSAENNRPSGHVFTGSDLFTLGTATVSPNAWTHLAVTYDGAALRLYVNGVQASTRAVTGAIRTSTGALRLGGNTVWAEWFGGVLDDVRIYNRALTAAELQADMAAGVS